MTQAKFDKRKYRFTYFKENPDQIQFINGKQYWGHDGGMPSTIYKSIVIRIGTKNLSLPAKAFDDLLNPVFTIQRSTTTQKVMYSISIP
ncbi:hypothetical protein [Paraflavitalea speifideaquila]|uniref:hypothetical protein n=1 Tax=Paraflavitalea speifideaquila TaxID=3076558 RepID=UPI0028EA1D42|nr:hypothetical protein [Paraflavitalea speifideiaquila]